MAARAGRRSRAFQRAEFWTATVVLGLPLLYLLGEYSLSGWWEGARYSRRHLAVIVSYAGAYAAFLASYSLTQASLTGIRSRVVLLATSTFLAVIAIEASLQVLEPMPFAESPNVGRHEYDPDVGHVYKPNFEQVLQTREWRQVWRSNGEGLRADRDYGGRRPGVYRVLVVGDSFTVGDQVTLADTYPAVLERQLADRLGPNRVEVLNGGFPSYGTVHAAGWLRKFGVRFQPDLVVLGMTPNDLVERNLMSVIARDGAMVRANASERELRRYQELSRWYNVKGIVDRSAFARRLRNLLASFDDSSQYVHRRAFLSNPDDAAREQYAFAERQLLDIHATAKSIGAELFILTIPFREQLEPMEEGLDPAHFGRTWNSFADRHHIPSVDLLDAFRRHPDPKSLYWVEDSHCTRAGYALIGTILAEAIWQNRVRLRLPDVNQGPVKN